jgi:hypothetical protein
MKIIEIKANTLTRKAYQLDTDEQHYLDFKSGVEVLPAMYYDSEIASGKFYFKQKHEPNTPMWKDGGYECYDDNGAFRAFHLDALIVHPRMFKKKIKSNITGVMIDKPKGKRGRPKSDPSLLKTKVEYVSTGRGRGRPKMDESLLKVKTQYIPNGGKRGRRPLSEEEKMKREAEKQLKSQRSNGKRGRPKK